MEKETLKMLKKPNNEVEGICIPFEIYSKDIKAGAKLLWGEYSKFLNINVGFFITIY